MAQVVEPNRESPKRLRGDWRYAFAKRFKISGRTLDRYRRVLHTPMVVQKAFSEGQLSLGESEKVGGKQGFKIENPKFKSESAKKWLALLEKEKDVR